jgi:hypothetical protein
MRVTILLFFLWNAQIIFSQKFRVSFNQSFTFTKGKGMNYESLIQKGGFQINGVQNGENMYIFDLTNNEAQLFFGGKLVRTIDIKNSLVEEELVTIEFDDYDLNYGYTIPVICVLNTSNDFSIYPYFMFYYIYNGNVDGNVVYER